MSGFDLAALGRAAQTDIGQNACQAQRHTRPDRGLTCAGIFMSRLECGTRGIECGCFPGCGLNGSEQVFLGLCQFCAGVGQLFFSIHQRALADCVNLTKDMLNLGAGAGDIHLVEFTIGGSGLFCAGFATSMCHRASIVLITDLLQFCDFLVENVDLINQRLLAGLTGPANDPFGRVVHIVAVILARMPTPRRRLCRRG